MNYHDEEEALEFINRLVERLHHAGHTNQGSKIEIVYVAPGAQHVEIKTHPLPLPIWRGVDCSAAASHMEMEKGGELEERIRQCLEQLMTEQYGEEPLFNLQGHWQAVYRILVDKGYCRDSDFDGFDAFIQRVMPEEVNKPYKKDSVRNINKTSFNKSFDRWRYDPDDYGTRKPFERMVAIAQRFKDILEENGL